jgi:hypothetical protein
MGDGRSSNNCGENLIQRSNKQMPANKQVIKIRMNNWYFSGNVEVLKMLMRSRFFKKLFIISNKNFLTEPITVPKSRKPIKIMMTATSSRLVA